MTAPAVDTNPAGAIQALLTAVFESTPGVDLATVLQAADSAGVPISTNQVERASGASVAEFYAENVVPVIHRQSDDEPRGGGSFRTYDSYWKVMVHGYPYQRAGVATRTGATVGGDPVPPEERLYPGLGDKPLVDVTYKDLVELVNWCRVRAELAAHWSTLRREEAGRSIRRFDQDGAVRNAVGALRYFYDQAVLAGVVAAHRNIAQRLNKPGKHPSPRRAFNATEYDELWTTITTGGDDPELDALIVETVLVTGARREGLLNLSRRDVDTIRATVWLDEKLGRPEEQPATPDLCRRLLEFATSRGATRPQDPVFCYKDSLARGIPHRLTSRRLDTLHTRIQTSLPWADRLGVTIHWFRHHAITTVERATSEAVAARFARHHDGGVTRTYDKATGEEVCAAVALVTGKAHPLADGGW